MIDFCIYPFFYSLNVSFKCQQLYIISNNMMCDLCIKKSVGEMWLYILCFFFPNHYDVNWKPTIFKHFLQLILKFRIAHEMHYKFHK